jgi:uncharacterized protein with HEPN domain
MKDERIYLVHMLETARKIAQRAARLTLDELRQSEDDQIILAHLIQVIGEAARMVGPATRAMITDVPWNQVTGMRHRIVHDYLNINIAIVWHTATVGIPELIPQLETALASLGHPHEAGPDANGTPRTS